MASFLQGKRIGILVGGGPAPGINGVISSVSIEAIITHGMEVIGFQNGFRHLVEGSLRHYRKLTIEEVAASYLVEQFGAERTSVVELQRGLFLNAGAPLPNKSPLAVR